jgi:hypothetical protein
MRDEHHGRRTIQDASHRPLEILGIELREAFVEDHGR